MVSKGTCLVDETHKRLEIRDQYNKKNMSERENMERKEFNWSSWLIPSKNIGSNIVRIKMAPETQQELGCLIGVDVFLEYPWAYVSREEMMRQSSKHGSSLACYRDKIGEYKAEYMLVGYASRDLTSDAFVMCLTEESRDRIVRRNREVTKNILQRVHRMVIKSSRAVYEAMDEETSAHSSRPPFEVAISRCSMPQQLVNRDSNDSRDSYVDLRPSDTDKSSIFMKQTTKGVQTTLKARETYVQTHLSCPKNKWTQSPALMEENEPPVDEKPSTYVESSPVGSGMTPDANKEPTVVNETPREQLELSLFLQSHVKDVLECLGYNSEINIHSDPILSLVTASSDCNSSFADVHFEEEIISLMDLRLTHGRVISDVSWHPNLDGIVAVAYGIESERQKEHEYSDCAALIWSISEPIQPRIVLNDRRVIQTISFCPMHPDILVGGCDNGQLILWCVGNFLDCPSDVSVKVKAASDLRHSHVTPVRTIHWLPPDCRIENNGQLIRLTQETSFQFMTSSEDAVVVWDIFWQPNVMSTAKNFKNIVAMSLTDGLEKFDDVFRPVYRLQFPKISDNVNVLDLCIESTRSFQITNPPRKLWLATAQGEIILCTWHGQEFQVASEETTELVCRAARVHDGPVVKVIRCQHLDDVLLSVGGRVFAIWRDDFLKSPILWRRRDCLYTSACWAQTPAVFILARYDGDLETWDLHCKTRQPVHVRTISGNSITGLSMQSWDFKSKYFLLGFCDFNGRLGILKEIIPNFTDEKIQWFREFVDRVVDRKIQFHAWQDEFLVTDQQAIARKAARADQDTKERHELARKKFLKQQEELARLKAEKKAQKIVQSKETLLRKNHLDYMKMTLLEKKGFDPEQLEKMRRPIVLQQQEKVRKINQAREKISKSSEYFNEILDAEFADSRVNKFEKSSINVENNEGIIEKYKQEYLNISSMAKKILNENSQVRIFNWNTAMQEGNIKKKF